jgi:hypothetical protein
MRETSGKFILDGLTPDELSAVHRLAASKGMKPETMVADLIRATLKFSA